MKSPKKVIYLACPYFHIDDKIMEERFEAVNKKAGELMKRGYIIFSPISHSHPIQQYLHKDDNNHDFWLEQDMPFLDLANELWVLELSGWHLSKGIKIEIAEAAKRGMPVKWITIGGTLS